MIEGVKKIPLKKIYDERGNIMHMLRASDPHFLKFGEIYFSWANPGYIKAWKKHKEITINFAVPVGVMQVVVYDDRPKSSTFTRIQEYILGHEDYYLLTIPVNVWYGFRAIGTESALIANCTTGSHDPNEALRRDPYDPLIPYHWSGLDE